MAWRMLVLAGLFEVCFAIGLEYSEGFSKPIPTLGTAIAAVLSLFLLARALEQLPVGTAYAVWTGIGAVGTAMVGIYLFDDPATIPRLGFIAVIITGIVGLHVVSGGP